MHILSLLLSSAWGRGVPFANQANTVPLDFLTTVFGTPDSLFGGLDFPLYTILQPFIPSSRKNLSDYCESVYESEPRWARRYAEARGANILKKKDKDEQWISLIDGPEQLASMSKEQLECLSRIGYVPDRVPLGQVYGRILWMIGPGWIQELSQAAWGGKIIIEFECDNKRNVTISCNNVGYGTGAFAHATVGSLPEGRVLDVLDDEAKSSGDWFWINYSQDFTQICPSMLPKSWQRGRQLVAGMFDNSWPARNVLDFGRWVGRDIDENLDIYLYKSRMISHADRKLTEPVIWFNLKSADLIQGVRVLRF